MNTLGHIFRLTTFGESHGPAMGGIIDGCPSGYIIDPDLICEALTSRQGNSPFSTTRREADQVEFLSGIFQGRTTGTPIAFLIRNQQQHSADYDKFRQCFRPGHGDLGLYAKYQNTDHRGGGRSSARETVSWVVAGNIALQILRQRFSPSLDIHAEVESIGGQTDYEQILNEAQQQGDTLGGIVRCTIKGTHLGGIGQPVFDKLGARLAHAMFAIPSTSGFEMGSGFQAATMRGSNYVDRYLSGQGSQMPYPSTSTNHCGGIQAGISNGMPIEFRVAFHPIVTLPQGIDCIHPDGSLEKIVPGGRHDICQVLRCPVIVESLAALTLLDLHFATTND